MRMLSKVAAPFTQRCRPVAWDSDLGSRTGLKRMSSRSRSLVFAVAVVISRKETVMPKPLFSPRGRLFSLPERGRVPVVIQMSQHCGSARIPARPPLPFQNVPSTIEMDMASRASAAGLGCVRGTSFAFLFEAGAALVVYGVCELWRLIR